MKESKQKKLGRPSTYSQELATEICNAISCSSKGIKKLKKENPHWPAESTIFIWLSMHASFSEQYARAKVYQVESLVDDILEIADDTSNDYVENADGVLIVNHENIQRSKLRIDTRKWLAAKLCPRLYGDKATDKPQVESLLETLIDKL